MSEVMKLAGFEDEKLEACQLRCGVGRLVPARQAVRKVFRGSVITMSGILPLEVLRGIFSQTIETVDELLFANENLVRAESTHSASPAPAPATCFLSS
jgi:hypothetical protein